MRLYFFLILSAIGELLSFYTAANAEREGESSKPTSKKNPLDLRLNMSKIPVNNGDKGLNSVENQDSVQNIGERATEQKPKSADVVESEPPTVDRVDIEGDMLA
eukprot:Platyproteum_vivax@DN13064_c0_g1_i1.p1